MKTTIKLLLVGSIALAATSCSDFLETEPRTQIAETEFYKTEDDMMKVRNLGRKSLEEVINKLAMMGLSLASEDNN